MDIFIAGIAISLFIAASFLVLYFWNKVVMKMICIV
jgi:hypothetical protein